MHSSSDVMDILEMTGRDSKKMGLMAGDSAKKPVGFNTNYWCLFHINMVWYYLMSSIHLM